MLSQLQSLFFLAASRALLEELPNLSAIASHLTWSLECFDFLIISFPKLVRPIDAVHTSFLNLVHYCLCQPVPRIRENSVPSGGHCATENQHSSSNFTIDWFDTKSHVHLNLVCNTMIVNQWRNVAEKAPLVYASVNSLKSMCF